MNEPINPLDIFKNAYANAYQGSLTELLQQEEGIAATPEEQAQGLSNESEPGVTKTFPVQGGERFHTQNMKVPMTMVQKDAQDNTLSVEESMQPGLVDIPINPRTRTVIETTEAPAFKTGGIATLASNYLNRNKRK
jgi:uncharacterized membrane protein (UPF0127 family)